LPLACASVLFFLSAFSAARAEGGLHQGKPAPAVRAELLGGGTFDTATRRGKVIVLNLWATWCKPCREEMPALEALYRAHRGDGLEVLAVSIEEPRDLGKVQAVMKQFSFPAALASSTRMAGYGRAWRIPVTYVIDRRGVLAFDGSKVANTLDLPAFEKLVLPLLRERVDARTAGPVAAEPVAAGSVATAARRK
jgi:thiol-disulfide isomerase/thioredoxin